MRIIFLVKLLLARIWRHIRGPVIEIDIKEAFDRMANPIISHRLLNLFDMDDESSAVYYQNYNDEIYRNQNGEWLEKFLGKSKKIPYWVTPWGGCAKDYSKRNRLDISYAREYVNKLREIKDSIAEKTYCPEKYEHITGEILFDENGKSRFIVWSGHRRILSLARLGYKKIKVEVSAGDRWEGKINNHVIRLSECQKWPNIRNKTYSQEEALRFFNHFFF